MCCVAECSKERTTGSLDVLAALFDGCVCQSICRRNKCGNRASRTAGALSFMAGISGLAFGFGYGSRPVYLAGVVSILGVAFDGHVAGNSKRGGDLRQLLSLSYDSRCCRSPLGKGEKAAVDSHWAGYGFHFF